MQSALEIKNKLDAKIDELTALQTTMDDREPDQEESERINALSGDGGEIAKLGAKYKQRLEFEETLRNSAKDQLGRQRQMSQRVMEDTAMVPARAKRHGTLKAFANTDQGERDSYSVGRWFMAKMMNHKPSEQWLRERGLFAQQEETAGQGLELVPEPLEAAILKRLAMISGWTQKVRTSVMTSATHRIPDRLAGLQVYYPDENVAIDPSHMTLGQQLLTARKMATLTQVGSELNEDSVISVMDMLADDIAHAIAVKNEQDCFLGDGSATYGGVTGLANSIGAASTVTGAGPAATDFTLANFEATIALNPFFQGSTPEWYCSSAVYAGGMLPLLNAAGGTPGTEIASGFQRMFMGFPVNIVQSMSAGADVSTDQVYFGDLSQAVYYGTRRGLTIATSSDYGFNTDSIYIRSTMRNAITIDNHDDDIDAVGPITALATAAA